MRLAPNESSGSVLLKNAIQKIEIQNSDNSKIDQPNNQPNPNPNLDLPLVIKLTLFLLLS